jgi:hypothetical protein
LESGRKSEGDGLQEKPDGTYQALEIKSGGGAHRSAQQNAFGKQASYDSPATVTLKDGTVVKITDVEVTNVNTGK